MTSIINYMYMEYEDVITYSWLTEMESFVYE